jgi:cyanophycinase
VLTFAFAFGDARAIAQSSHGPTKGSLILTGGGYGEGVIERFVELAGGTTAKIVYIPTGAESFRLPSGYMYDPSNSSYPSASTKDFENALKKQFGVDNIVVVHTRDRYTADSDNFVADLRTASGVWLSSGNQGLFAKAYLDTKTQRELARLLDRGGVIGGNSAGAMMLGSYIIRGRPDKPVLMAKDYDRGFGFLTKAAVNPFLTEQKHENELINVVDAFPDVLGIGIDELAAIVVRGDRFEVIGNGRVAIYDNRQHNENWYYWLRPGDRFDLAQRQITFAPFSDR